MLAELERALREDAEQAVGEALRVSVCITHGLTRAQTAERLGIPPARVRAGVDRLRSAALRLGWHPEQF